MPLVLIHCLCIIIGKDIVKNYLNIIIINLIKGTFLTKHVILFTYLVNPHAVHLLTEEDTVSNAATITMDS